MQRILNPQILSNHGNIKGRKDIVEIMETALQAANPYTNMMKLLRREGNMLYLDGAEFEARNDPQSGTEVIDLDKIDNVYVFGAAKGIQWVVKAIEDALGDYLSGGHVIAKHDDEPLLKKVGVTYGGHPVPDADCVKGCKEIQKYADRITEKDLVFTVAGNGVSSLLTLPEEGISIEDVSNLTYLMQINRGAYTDDLNFIRNHVDQLKGGKLSRMFSKARLVCIEIIDANHHTASAELNAGYNSLMTTNVWLHNLPDSTTYEGAVKILHKYNAWDECPGSIKKHLLKADPRTETVRFDEFSKWRFRVYGTMPGSTHFLLKAKQKAAELGYNSTILSNYIGIEASQAGHYASSLALNIERFDEPIKKPAALFSTGEMIVTVGGEKGVGGRNQEFALAAALKIAGSKRITIGSADTDGTDGPGHFKFPGAPECLAGGIVDGYTVEEAKQKGVDIQAALKKHATSEALWKLDCGMDAVHCISIVDLTVLLIQ